jgi:hypothetical protein
MASLLILASDQVPKRRRRKDESKHGSLFHPSSFILSESGSAEPALY